MAYNIEDIKGREPLEDYSWSAEVDRLLSWLQAKDPSTRAFCFDLVMSAAYLDATSGVEASLEQCENVPSIYNTHLGFINLCSPCYVLEETWVNQKAVKPQSGALGKLSSEVILKFVEKLYPKLTKVVAVGGTEVADAVLYHENGDCILAEVKSAPLMTYPFFFQVPETSLRGHHQKVVLTSSQLKTCRSAISLHDEGFIDLGQPKDDNWPFSGLVSYLTNPQNEATICKSVEHWKLGKEAYTNKERSEKVFYLVNASGRPPAIARDRDDWPQKASISDGKTSAGMDRTDDIKKGIYQTLKIGKSYAHYTNVKTALVSNLPAYRHGDEYVAPFVGLLWGEDSDIATIEGLECIPVTKLKRIFDLILTLEEPILREVDL